MKKVWLLGICAVAACSDDPLRPPEVCAPLEDVALYIGEVSEVEACFFDTNQGTLDYKVISSDPSVVAVRFIPPGIDDPLIAEARLEGLAVGASTITLTVTNGEGGIDGGVFSGNGSES